tara:strand:+ start:1227 stop:1991 length:765 start_codon:yes stop_codon:yes gene_type:complete
VRIYCSVGLIEVKGWSIIVSALLTISGNYNPKTNTQSTTLSQGGLRGRTYVATYYFTYFILFTMSNAYENALATGKTVVRRWWANARSTKNQVSVQFQQEIDGPVTASSLDSVMIALEQGTEALGGKQRPTAIRSMSAEQAIKLLGAMEGSCNQEGDAIIYADDVYGFPTGIEVKENFEKNPYSASQQPKSNPSTGEVITAVNPANGAHMPVYRHTKLTAAEQCSHSFVDANAEVATAAPSTFVAAGAAVGLES